MKADYSFRKGLAWPFFLLGSAFLLQNCGFFGSGDVLSGEVVVEKNPHGIAPLTAQLEFATDRPVKATIEVPGKAPLVHTFPEYEKTHTLPVAGLYPDKNNPVILTLEDEDSVAWRDTLYIETDTLPAKFPEVSVDKVDTGKASGKFVLGDLAIGQGGHFHSFPVFLDPLGTIRWYLDLRFMKKLTIPFRRLDNGHFVGGTHGRLYEFDLLGKKVDHWNLDPYSVHHEIMQLTNGHLLMTVSKKSARIFNGKDTVNSKNDFIIEFDRKEGKVVREWDLREVMDVTRYDLEPGGENGDWGHTNSLAYDPRDSTLIVSMKNQGMAKIDGDNELQWILAPHKGWGKAGPYSQGFATADHLLTAVDSSGAPYPAPVQRGEKRAPGFDWPWGQHAPFLMENGDIMVFDNGFRRRFEPGRSYSRALQLRVNEKKGTVKQVWQYGKARGKSFFSLIISDVDRLEENGNLFITSGFCKDQERHYAKLLEVTYPDKEVVYEATMAFKDQKSDKKGFGWGNFDILYRAERMDLYPTSRTATPPS